MEYSEEERLEAIRDWWRRWGKVIIAAILAGIIAIIGTRYWMEQQAARGEAASTLYGRMVMLAETDDWAGADDMAQRLVAEFAGTPYGPLAALVRARAAMAESDHDAALDHLAWAEERAEPRALRSLASLRRARILIEIGEAQDALERARKVADDSRAHRGSALEVQGDALVELDRPADALAAYRGARDSARGGSATLGMKIDTLAGRVEEAVN